MRSRTLRLACLLIAAALIAGCGGASVTTSSTARTASSARAKKAHTHRKRHRTRARRRASRPKRFPASVESAFRRTCAAGTRKSLTHAPVQYRAAISAEVGGYCTCALQKVEASVATKQFENDMVNIVFHQAAQPAYMLSAEKTCGAQLQQTLVELSQAGG
jgi:hypothetical protein